MSEHVTDRLALEMAAALEPEEAAEVAAHLAQCASCAARAVEWRALGEALRRLPQARPSPELVDRVRHAVEWQRAERTERVWNRAALGFLLAFAWVLAGAAWLLFDLLDRALLLCQGRSVGSAAVWCLAYVVAGWVMAAAAAVLLGGRAREEGRSV